MKYLSLTLGMCLLTIGLVGCSSKEEKAKQTQEIQKVVVFDDGYETSKDGEVIIDDQDYYVKTIRVTSKQNKESVKSGKYGSQINIMYDGFGNKTITRMFNDHPIIAGIVSRTSAKGITQNYLYTKDGLVKEISAKFSDLVESASGNEIARIIGVSGLQEYDVYNPMLAKVEADNSKEPYEINNVDYQFEPANSIQTTSQNTAEPNKPKQVERVKEEVQKEKQIVASPENSFLEEFIETQEDKISSVLTVKKKD